MMQTQANNLPTNTFLEKPAQQEVQWNSQGERIEVPSQSAPASIVQGQQQAPLLECSYVDISLGDTALAGPADSFYPPTDDSGLVHAVIACGHVLKSTHDLARWSEKTGARRVNSQEALDAVSDLIISSEEPRAAQQADSSPKPEGSNTNRNNGWNGRRAKNGQKSAQPAELAGKTNSRDSQSRQKRGSFNRTPRQPSQIVNSWPVLKSTHDVASWSEKKGANPVNSAESVGSLSDLACNERARGVQAGGATGGSLQSGLDTQAGSHVQLDGSKGKETPEKAMEALHVHV